MYVRQPPSQLEQPWASREQPVQLLHTLGQAKPRDPAEHAEQPLGLPTEAMQWQPSAREAPAPHSRHSAGSPAAAAPCSSGALESNPLHSLREAAWQAAEDKRQAKEAVLVAFVSGPHLSAAPAGGALERGCCNIELIQCTLR